MIPHNKLPPTFSRGRLAPAIAGRRVHSSHSSFSRRSFFEPPPCRRPAVIDRRYRSGSNEVERANILAPGFRVRQRPDASSFPPSPPNFSEIGHGKSYPVTAAQLPPNLTGIPRTGSTDQLTKNCPQK